MSLWGTRTRARTNKWDMTAEPALSCLSEEIKCSVYKSGHLDNAKQIISYLNISQDDVARSRKPLQAHLYIRLACPPYIQSPEPSTRTAHLCYRITWLLQIYSTLPTLIYRTEHLIATTQSSTTVENLKCNVMPSACQSQLLQMLILSRRRLYKSVSGPRTPVLESANGQQQPWGFGRRRVAWQHNGKIIKWGCTSGRLPTPWETAPSNALPPSIGISISTIALLESVVWRLTGCFGNGTWQTRITSVGRDSRQLWAISQRLAFAEGRIGSTKPWLGSGNSCTLVCISLPRCFFCSAWSCVDTADDNEDTSGHRSSLIKACHDASTNFLIKPFSFTIPYVDSDITEKRVGGNNAQLFWWHWPRDDESIRPILTSRVNTTILWIVHAAITGLPDLSWKIRELCGCQEEPNGDGRPHAHDVNPIFDTNTAAGWIEEGMQLINPMVFWVIYRGQQAESTSGAPMTMHGGRSYLHLDDIWPPPSEDMIDDIRNELDDDAETWCPNPSIFLRTKSGFQKFERMLQRRFVRQQRSLEVIRNRDLGLFAN